MHRSVASLLFIAAAGCGAIEPASHATSFDAPIVGTPTSNVFYGAYVDEGGGDYSCGPKFYDGHRGTDILLRSFRTQDSGVTVLAAAPGTIADLHDGESDRNTTLDPGRRWNFVSILHSDGLVSYYGHLRTHSLKVTVGQRVSSGTPLGLVGSSGFSNWPHLHFEVRLRDSVVDPWHGDCHGNPSLWRNQLGYQNQFQVLDVGILDKETDGPAELLERPADAEPVTGRNGVVTVWAEFSNIRAALRVELRAADGTVIQSADYPQVSTFSTLFAAVAFPIAVSLPPGAYTTVLLTRPTGAPALQEVARRTFTLTPVAAPLALRILTRNRPSLRVFAPAGDGPLHP